MKKIITFGIVFILLSFNILGLTLQFTEDESDPIYSSVADELITNATNGNIAYGWGDHSLVGYIKNGEDTLGNLSCSTDQITKYNGSDWICSTDETGGAGSGIVTGSGTSNSLPYWTNSTNLGDSPASVSGTDVIFSNAIRLGTTTDTTAGNLRYTNNDLQYYNTSEWVSVGGSGGVADTTCEDGICNLSDDTGYKYTSLDFDGTTGLSDGVDDNDIIPKWGISYPYLENRTGNLAINSSYFNATYIQDTDTTNWDKDSTDDYTSTDFDTDFSGKTTNDLTEGTNLYYNDSSVVNNLQTSVAILETNDPNDYDSYDDLPIASPTNGDTTHFSNADQIYDFVTGFGYITDGNTGWDNSYGFITNGNASFIQKWSIDGIYLINSSNTLTWQMSDEMYTNITTTNGNTTNEINNALLETYPNLDVDSTDDFDGSFNSLNDNSEIITNATNGNIAYSWGNHALAGYITDGNTNWDNIYGFITDSSLIPKWNIDNIYLINSSGTLTWQMSDEMYLNITSSNGNTTSEITQAMLDTYPNLDTDLTDDFDGTFTSLTGTDELVTNATNGNIAYSWGNHATAGYLTSESDPTVNKDGYYTNITNLQNAGYITDGNTNWENQYNYWNDKINWSNAITYLDIVNEWGCTGTLKSDGTCDNNAYVSSVTASSPISSTGGQNPDISLNADSIDDTYLMYNTGQDLTTNSNVEFQNITISQTHSIGTSNNQKICFASNGTIIIDAGAGITCS